MGFLKEDTDLEDREITEVLFKLRDRLIPELTTEDTASVPKMAWKMVSTYQCLIRRTLEAADGMKSAWDAGNLLTTITMARSLIEIGAIVRHLTDSIKKATKEKDVDALDKAIMNVGFGARIDLSEGGEEWEYKALNVLTMIDRMDKGMFRDKNPRLRKTYDFLSEFVHPNHFGILGLYSDGFPNEYRVEFGRIDNKKEMILDHLNVTLNMIWLVQIDVSDIGKLIPAFLDIVPK
jgi:hypothetical protein